MTRLVLGAAALAMLALSGCVYQEYGPPCLCDEDPALCAPSSGDFALEARSLRDDYTAATASFEWATVEDSELVANDWDLLFGNDRDPAADYFSVNTVTDDDSFIVDLGEIGFGSVPETVDPASYPAGLYGKRDDIPVVAGHLYLVRTLDGNTRQYAAFRVLAHALNESVTIRWLRSPEPDRFVLDQ